VTTELLESLEPMILGIAQEYGRKFHIYGADSSDYAQELRIWVLENVDKVNEWMDDEQYSADHADRMIAKSLRNRCKGYGLEVKAQAVGYKVDDLVFYTENEITHLLSLVFDPEKWHEPPQSEGRSTKAPSEGGGWIATLADIAQGIERLDESDQQILRARHQHGEMNKTLAERCGVSEQTMSHWHMRAIKRLHKELGGARPEFSAGRDPWRGRRAIGNSHAQAITGSDYDA
jgi:RNA polymerase sigma factor (sigma-70 family)